jgi:hypothetical protein
MATPSRGYFTNTIQSDNQDIENFTNNINEWANETVSVLAIETQSNYTNFTQKTLTAGNVAVDKSTQNIMANMTTVKQIGYSTNWSQAGYFFGQYLYKTLLNSTFYQIPWYEILESTSLQLESNCNWAVRLRFFDYNVLYAKPVITIVDCMTGEEKFRVVAPDSENGVNETNNPSYLRYIKRVNNGIVETNTTLTFGEMLKINTCIITNIDDYLPWTTLEAAKKNTDPTKDPDENSVTVFQDAVAKEPFQDGVNGNITMEQIRLFALDPIDSSGNYLFNIPFLPWNNGTYMLFDNQVGEYIGFSPFNTSNFLTIVKIIGIGIIIYELFELFRSGKLTNKNFNL